MVQRRTFLKSQELFIPVVTRQEKKARDQHGWTGVCWSNSIARRKCTTIIKCLVQRLHQWSGWKDRVNPGLLMLQSCRLNLMIPWGQIQPLQICDFVIVILFSRCLWQELVNVLMCICKVLSEVTCSDRGFKVLFMKKRAML